MFFVILFVYYTQFTKKLCVLCEDERRSYEKFKIQH